MTRRLALVLFVLIPPALPAHAAEVSWHMIDGYGTAFPLYLNSHATAGGWVTAYHGLRRPGESDKTLIHAAWVYMQSCDCGGTTYTNWDVLDGMRNLFNARGYPHTAFKECCRYSDKYGEQCDFSDYVERIKANLPVIVTYTYHRYAEHGLLWADGRTRDCLSMVGVGYMYYNGHGVLICHDGLIGGQANPAQRDKIDPARWGLATSGAPWNQPGTSLYRWDGDYTNVLMVFVGRPE